MCYLFNCWHFSCSNFLDLRNLQEQVENNSVSENRNRSRLRNGMPFLLVSSSRKLHKIGQIQPFLKLLATNVFSLVTYVTQIDRSWNVHSFREYCRHRNTYRHISLAKCKERCLYCSYCISLNSFCGNYSFLKVEIV